MTRFLPALGERDRRRRGMLFAALALGLVLLPLAGAGCGGTRACKSGTLLLTVTFEGSAASADRVALQVVTDGGAPRTAAPFGTSRPADTAS